VTNSPRHEIRQRINDLNSLHARLEKTDQVILRRWNKHDEPEDHVVDDNLTRQAIATAAAWWEDHLDSLTKPRRRP
jgi:hypothetical protein